VVQTSGAGQQDAEAYYVRGLTYKNLGQQELADRDFQKAKELGFDP
jgi:Flp pilus assembly protein TadD